LVLPHGAWSATGTSFGELIPSLAKTRQVISIEPQAPGHTADIDRPLRIEQVAEDTTALLRQIGVAKADFFGYSAGSAIALDIGIRHPDLVGKLALASVMAIPAGSIPACSTESGTSRPKTCTVHRSTRSTSGSRRGRRIFRSWSSG
jgi:pimeloyl-ACP methyl ester carboxylesterase